jgi:hypothetical protein
MLEAEVLARMFRLYWPSDEESASIGGLLRAIYKDDDSARFFPRENAAIENFESMLRLSPVAGTHPAVACCGSG